MPAQSLANRKRRGTGGAAKRRTFARQEYEFLTAAKRGDSAAFETLCKQSANTVFHVARRMMRNNEDAEDVVQESLQQAFVHLKSFNGDSRFSTWLSRIAINAALMKLRKKRHLWDVSLDDSAETEESSFRIDIEDQGLNPEQLYAEKERQRILFEAMNDLTPGLRKAMELREIDERSTEETAQIMGISVGAVKARVFHGRRKLRERLKRYVGSAWVSGMDASRTIGNTTHSTEIRSAAMRVVKTGTRGGPYDAPSVSRGIGDFGLSMFHRPGWFFRPEAPSLSRVSDVTISLGERKGRTRV